MTARASRTATGATAGRARRARTVRTTTGATRPEPAADREPGAAPAFEPRPEPPPPRSTDVFELDDDARYRAMTTRDARFDGWFFIGVRTTGIYCRPSCPTPIQPKRTNIDFYPTAAAAQQAGFRACKRCRPDATPGSPAWNLRSDLAGRALRSIADGVVDRDGVAGLARVLAVSERHLNRVLTEQVGAGPLALARAQRAQTARVLIETTGLPFADVAFAAGFASVRQFNDTVREVFASTPTELRAAATRRAASGARRRPGSASPLDQLSSARSADPSTHLPGGPTARDSRSTRPSDSQVDADRPPDGRTNREPRSARARGNQAGPGPATDGPTSRAPRPAPPLGRPADGPDRPPTGPPPGGSRHPRPLDNQTGPGPVPDGQASESVAVDRAGAPPIAVRLPVRLPFDAGHLLGFLADRAVPGVEAVHGSTYARSLVLPHGPAVVELSLADALPPGDDRPSGPVGRAGRGRVRPSSSPTRSARTGAAAAGDASTGAATAFVDATFHLADVRDLAAATARTRRLLDLDADPTAIDAALADDPSLAPAVLAHPGRRSPGAVDPHELAIRAVIGQQISVPAARTVAARLAEAHGEPVAPPVGDGPAAAITRTFPGVDVLAGVDPTTLPMPRARGRTVVALADALAGRRVVLGPGADRAAATHALLAVPGIGPWTASYVAMRSLSDPDAFLATDLAVLKGAANLGLPVEPAALADHARRWRPWRSYATHHLWSASIDPPP